MKLILDSKECFRKPSHLYHLHNRLNLPESVTEITVKDLALQLSKGKTCVPSLFSAERNNENWVSQELFMLDMDSGVTFSKSLDIAKKNSLDFTFAYETFSSTKEVPKYRLCFKLTKPINNGEVRDKKLRKLVTIFGSDVKCVDRARLFFGGTSLIYTNYEYELNLDDI